MIPTNSDIHTVLHITYCVMHGAEEEKKHACLQEPVVSRKKKTSHKKTRHHFIVTITVILSVKDAKTRENSGWRKV